MLLAFANQKGGVGKTTTAINLGAFLALRGQPVLLIDLDPQANATSSLGLDKRALLASVYDVLVQGLPWRQVVLPTRIPGLDLLPAAPALAGAEVELASEPDRARFLADRLALDPPTAAWVLIDCPPSLGLLTVNALTAARGVLIPVQCEYLALEGLTQLIETIGLVRDNLNPQLDLFGLVMTMFDSRLHLAQQVVDQVNQHFPDQVFRTVIPRSVRIAEAPSYGEPLATFDPHSRGALAYAALADEFMARAGVTPPAPEPAVVPAAEPSVSAAPPAGEPAPEPAAPAAVEPEAPAEVK